MTYSYCERTVFNRRRHEAIAIIQFKVTDLKLNKSVGNSFNLTHRCRIPSFAVGGRLTYLTQQDGAARCLKVAIFLNVSVEGGKTACWGFHVLARQLSQAVDLSVLQLGCSA